MNKNNDNFQEYIDNFNEFLNIINNNNNNNN